MNEPVAESPVREGDVVADKYRVERVLGVGGMGVVVAALHMDLDERVALKFLLPQAAAHANVSARFAQEARTAAKIRSEHVARVIDVGRMAATGAPYMVMEYLDGEDLEQLVQARGPLPADVAVTYLLQASEAIAEAHSLGIVHRDLKPANLFLARRPSGGAIVKVLDFGISKTTTPGQAQLTKTSAMLGSPLYMSPEQMSAAKTVDARADVWGLGVVLYHLVSGNVPFRGDTLPELVASILQSPPAPLEASGVKLPPALYAVILRCLEKDPGARFQSVYELAVALAEFSPATSAVSVQRIAHLLSAGGGPPAPARGPSMSTSSSVEVVTGDAQARRPEGSRRGLVLGVAAGMAVLAAIGAGFVLGGRTHAQPVSTAAPLASPPAPAAPASAPSPPSAPVAAPDVAPPPTGIAPAAAVVPSKESLVAPSPPAARPSSANPSAAARAASRGKAHAPASSAQPVDCDPPYVIDPAGHRLYKPECIP